MGEPDMDKLDTEIGVMEATDKSDMGIMVTSKLHTQVATMIPMVTRKDILNTLHITSTPSTHTVVITTRENMEARTNLNDYDLGVKNYREYLRYKDYYGKSKYYRPT